MIDISNLVEQRDSYIWPKSDKRCWDYMLRYPDLPFEIDKFVESHQVVVQAGGNCGFYPKKYATLFNRVYTFEPEWLNFYCLCRNVTETNVVKIQACLGEKPSMVDLAINEKNRGKNFINGAGKYPVLQIDQLGLDSCDLIHLDIEGYEYYALMGAKNTITQFKPTIVVEVWDQLDNRFEKNLNNKLADLFHELDYVYITTFHESDKVYVHKSKNNYS